MQLEGYDRARGSVIAEVQDGWNWYLHVRVHPPSDAEWLKDPMHICERKVLGPQSLRQGSIRSVGVLKQGRRSLNRRSSEGNYIAGLFYIM